jgi:hypothetical protein
MPRGPKPPPDSESYEPIWPRLAERLRQEVADLEERRPEAAAQAEELLALPLPERQRAIRGEPRFHSLALAQELMRRGRAALPGDPTAARPPLWGALDLLRILAERPESPAEVLVSLRSEAAGLEAESHLLVHDLERAEQSLVWVALALRDSPDGEARSRFFQRLAWVRTEQERSDEAIALFARAGELALGVGDRQRAAELQMQEALLRQRRGETVMAEALREIARRQGAALDPDAPSLAARLESLTDPAVYAEGQPWKETFLARLTDPEQSRAFRIVGQAIEEHLSEFARHLPREPEAFPVTDLRAAAADLRALQGYLADRGRAQFEAADLAAGQLDLCRLAGETALGLTPWRESLEAALPAFPRGDDEGGRAP